MNYVPEDALTPITKKVWEEAERIGYLTCTKPQSRIFMETLVQRPDVGGVLANYMDKTAVKTYIKDGILHDYTDAMKAQSVPTKDNLIEWCKNQFNVDDFHVVEHINHDWKKILVLRSDSKDFYIIIVDGSFKQWGIAIQKALEYISDKPFAQQSSMPIHLVLSLYCKRKPVSHIEKMSLTKALSYIGGQYRLYGEC